MHRVTVNATARIRIYQGSDPMPKISNPRRHRCPRNGVLLRADFERPVKAGVVTARPRIERPRDHRALIGKGARVDS